MGEKRMFQVGDFVRCTRDYADQFTKDKVYRITRLAGEKAIRVVDDRGQENGFGSDIQDIYFSLVRAADAPFKKGDVVRVLPSAREVYVDAREIGQLRTIYRNDDGCSYDYQLEDKHGFGVRAQDIELVEPVEALEQTKGDKQMSELEQLVAKAQDALSALTRAEGFKERVEVRLTDNTYAYYPIAFRNIRFVLKPTLPAPFRLKDSGHEVKFSERRNPKEVEVHVGCQTFSVDSLRRGLNEVVLGYRAVAETGVEARRSGVYYRGHTIPWSDAEQLLSVLESIKEGV